MTALPQIILPRAPHRLVLFVDEIDAVRSLPFSADEFFAGIRECYNRRTQEPEFARLTFCLLGVATPADLISDTRLSPSTSAHESNCATSPLKKPTPWQARWEIEKKRRRGEEEKKEKLPLNPQLSTLNRVLYWTGGHPYMTQRLCRALVESEGNEGAASTTQVDKICEDLFLTHQARETDDNLAFARNRLLRSKADLASLLDLYQQARNGHKVKDDETNPLCSILRLSGVVKVEQGLLKPRNRIYDRVFDRDWITAHMPDAELRRQRIAYRKGLVWALGLSSVVLLVMSILAGAAFMQKGVADTKTREADRNYQLAVQKAQESAQNAQAAKQNAEGYQNQMHRAMRSETRESANRLEAERQAKRAQSSANAALKAEAQAKRLAQQRAEALGRATRAQQREKQAAATAIAYENKEMLERQRAEHLLYPNLIARAYDALTQGNISQARSYLAHYAQPGLHGEDLRGLNGGTWRGKAGRIPACARCRAIIMGCRQWRIPQAERCARAWTVTIASACGERRTGSRSAIPLRSTWMRPAACCFPAMDARCWQAHRRGRAISRRPPGGNWPMWTETTWMTSRIRDACSLFRQTTPCWRVATM